jgi:Uma2 family endonuclease
MEGTRESVRRKKIPSCFVNFRHAGITEYWLVDARGERLSFEILRRGPKGYTSVRRQGGWVKSTVFGKSFKLARNPDRVNNPSYTPSVR